MRKFLPTQRSNSEIMHQRIALQYINCDKLQCITGAGKSARVIYNLYIDYSAFETLSCEAHAAISISFEFPGNCQYFTNNSWLIMTTRIAGRSNCLNLQRGR